MTRLVLVRHAEPVPPQPGDPDGPARPLSPRGREQARELVPTLVSYEPKRVLSSPYLRAVQTVEPSATVLGLPVEPRDALHEWASGHDPATDWRDHCRRAWNEPTWSSATGETHLALTTRAVSALFEVAAEHPADTVVIGTHGCWVSRALYGLGAPVDFDFWQALPLPAVIEVRVRAGRVQSIAAPGLPAG